MTKRLFFSLLALLSATIVFSATLFKDGKTDYVIVISQQASTSEKTAAKELGEYLREISGARFATSSTPNPKGHNIYIGWDSMTGRETGASRPSDGDEGFTYMSLGSDIYIYGGRERGTMYGVYTFLEREFGVRWYTADCTKVPKRQKWSFKSLRHSEEPAIKFRLNLYHGIYDNPSMAAHNLSNMSYLPSQSDYGDMLSGSEYHTMPKLLPKDEYFKKHPEYFALRNGKRTKDGQLCLSNYKVLEIVTQNLLKYIKQHPNYSTYDVSQADNQLFCECENCKAVERQYGGAHSGIMIWFVNKVAENVERQYPKAKLCTFAYQYTRKAPKNIKTHKNVIVRLCDIECCFAHPISECPQNKAFVNDLKEWREITDKLFIWDYVVAFGQYLAPFPNFAVLASNIQTFKENGAFALLEEGQYETFGGDFQELRSWLLCKLMWNPYQDTEKLVKEFIQNYYGPAAPQIQRYYELTQKLIGSDTHLYITLKHDDAIFSDSFISAADKILAQALHSCQTQEQRERVERVTTQTMYLKCRRNPIKAKADGTYNRLLQIIDKNKAYVREGHGREFLEKQMDGI